MIWGCWNCCFKVNSFTMSENERRCYWSSCIGVFISTDKNCLDLGIRNGFKFADAIQQMFQEPIIFKSNGIQKTAPIAMQTPMPELSHHTCFCSKHSKRIRDFLKSLEEKTNQRQHSLRGCY